MPPGRLWTAPHYLGSTDPALYAIGLTFMRRTFGLCVACFAVTCLMSGALLMLWGNGLEAMVFTDVCTHYTHWSCTQVSPNPPLFPSLALLLLKLRELRSGLSTACSC